MTYSLDEIAKAMRKPLELNGKPGDKSLVITDTSMDPMLWMGSSQAASELEMEPAVAIGLNPKVTPTGIMRTDKKMYGTSRLEGVIRKPEISMSGVTLTRDGKILV